MGRIFFQEYYGYESVYWKFLVVLKLGHQFERSESLRRLDFVTLSTLVAFRRGMYVQVEKIQQMTDLWISSRETSPSLSSKFKNQSFVPIQKRSILGGGYS